MSKKEKEKEKKKSAKKKYEFGVALYGWNRFKIDKKYRKTLQQGEDDLKKYKVEIDDELAKFAVVIDPLVEVIRNERSLIQKYVYMIWLTIPADRVAAFKEFLYRKFGDIFDDYELEDYPWVDHIGLLAGVGSPEYLILDNDRFDGYETKRKAIKKLWRAMQAT